MYDLNATGPAPDDLATRTVFEKVQVPLYELAISAERAGQTLAGRRFVDCVVHGPCVVIPDRDTRFNHCNMGDIAGNVRNLFLRAAGPMITGALPLNNCLFEGCIFLGVGFAGDDAFVDSFSAALDTRTAP